VWFSDVDLPVMSMTHASCGGMSEGTWLVNAYLQQECWTLREHSALPGRDMLSFINTTVQGTPSPAPSKLTLVKPRVLDSTPGFYRVESLCP
jgi:hypothetical protein